MSHKQELWDAAREWLEQDDDEETRAELRDILKRADVEALNERFGGRLQFGTAGLRGILGAGPNRMNRVMVRRVTAGLAEYLKSALPNARERGVVLGHDARRKADVFVADAASVLLGAGFKVHLLPALVPTPLTSFATTRLGAAAGVMVTASHNPPEYNGYKVFWETGGQIIPPHDAGISAAIDLVGRTDLLPMVTLEEARAQDRLLDVGSDLFEAYLKGISKLGAHPSALPALKLAYTPLHGVGLDLTRRALAKAGLEHFRVVPDQAEPDGSFPTVRFPNPEEKGAMDAVIELARDSGSDLAIATDPDADRLAVAAPEVADGDFEILGGDEVGALLAHYLLTEGHGGPERLVATTIVSSRMLAAIAEYHGISYLDTLTGLKWIADAALRHKQEHGSRLVLGYENALGYTIGELVRDKDGVSATLVFAEMAAWLKTQGRTVLDYLEEANRLYGLYLTRTTSLVFDAGEAGKIASIMDRVRKEPPAHLGDMEVTESIDMSRGDRGLPPENLFVHHLEGGTRVLIRPSGTEPKLKSYYEVKEVVQKGEPVSTARARARAALDSLEKTHQAWLRAAAF